MAFAGSGVQIPSGPSMKSKVELILYDTYLAFIKNSVGSKIFRNSYAKVNGKKVDILHNGKLSCAVYVSSLLVLFKLIKEPHAVVDSTVKDLLASNWKIVKEPKAGSILVWGEVDFGDNEKHKHIGFYLGNKKALSNRTELGYPVKHHWTYGGKRKIEMILWNDKLEKL